MAVSRWGRAAYGVAAVLALVELAVLVVALNPQVSDSYRARYIAGISDCWEMDVSGEYEIGTWLRANTPTEAGFRALLRCGWLKPERFGVWSQGEEAKLWLRLPATRKDMMLDLTLAPFAADRGVTQRVMVSAGGVELARFVLDRTLPVTRRVPVPASLPLDERGVLELDFTLPDAVSGKELGFNSDFRRFGVRVVGLRLGEPE